MRKVFLLGLTLLCAGAWADVSQVNIWKAHPGKNAALMESAMRAKAIHEKHGARVTIGQNNDLDMHYVVSFDNWGAYGKFSDTMRTSEEWARFWQDASVDPSGELIKTYMIDTPVAAAAKPVSMVYSWDVQPGRTADFVAVCEGAMPIHKRLGASPGINIDELGDVHYELTFDSWEAWGNYVTKAQTDEEWSLYVAQHSENSVASLVKVWQINVMN